MCGHGDHICALYESDEEQVAIASEYVAEGLRAGDRCLYVGASRAALECVRLALRALGIDVAAMLDRRALVEGTHAEAHLAGGRFDCERMLALLDDALEAALNDGFVGLRTCGDMSWLLDDPPGSEQVVEYEALCNQFFQNARATGMCLYDRRRPPGLIDHALATHPSAVLERRHKGNPFYQPPAVAAIRSAEADDLDCKLSELRRR